MSISDEELVALQAVAREAGKACRGDVENADLDQLTHALALLRATKSPLPNREALVAASYRYVGSDLMPSDWWGAWWLTWLAGHWEKDGDRLPTAVGELRVWAKELEIRAKS